jgi:hypothetical protein
MPPARDDPSLTLGRTCDDPLHSAALAGVTIRTARTPARWLAGPGA